MMNKHKKKRIWIGAGIIILLALAGVFLAMRPARPAELSRCGDSAYDSVKNGLSKAEITTLLGAPDLKHVKDSPDQDFFSQGDNEKNIQEGWIYHLQEWKSAEIYFDSAGRVIGKDCGQG